MLHTTLVLSIVPSFWLLNRDSPPNNPSALSIFNYRSGSQTFSVIPHFEQGGLLVGQAPYLICPRGHRFKSGLMSFPNPLPTSSPPCFLSYLQLSYPNKGTKSPKINLKKKKSQPTQAIHKQTN